MSLPTLNDILSNTKFKFDTMFVRQAEKEGRGDLLSLATKSWITQDPSISVEAIKALARIGDTGDKSALVEALEDNDSNVREAANSALIMMGLDPETEKEALLSAKEFAQSYKERKQRRKSYIYAGFGIAGFIVYLILVNAGLIPTWLAGVLVILWLAAPTLLKWFDDFSAQVVTTGVSANWKDGLHNAIDAGNTKQWANVIEYLDPIMHIEPPYQIEKAQAYFLRCRAKLELLKGQQRTDKPRVSATQYNEIMSDLKQAEAHDNHSVTDITNGISVLRNIVERDLVR